LQNPKPLPVPNKKPLFLFLISFCFSRKDILYDEFVLIIGDWVENKHCVDIYFFILFLFLFFIVIENNNRDF